MKQLFYFRLEPAGFLTFILIDYLKRQWLPKSNNEDQMRVRVLFFKRTAGDFGKKTGPNGPVRENIRT